MDVRRWKSDTPPNRQVPFIAPYHGLLNVAAHLIEGWTTYTVRQVQEVHISP